MQLSLAEFIIPCQTLLIATSPFLSPTEFSHTTLYLIEYQFHWLAHASSNFVTFFASTLDEAHRKALNNVQDIDEKNKIFLQNLQTGGQLQELPTM